MKTPLVSILVTTYNHEKYIRDCLDGILMQQTKFRIEILVGNDCSTDKTESIVKEYQKCFPNIRLITPSSNIYQTGKTITCTHLLSVAQGKYVAFCEGDDYWTYPYKLQTQIDFLEREDSYTMCFHAHQLKDSTNTLIPIEIYNPKEKTISINELLNHGVCQLSTVVGRRECLTIPEVELYFNHPKHNYGDINYYMAWASQGKIMCMPQFWSVYRRHLDSLTANDNICDIAHIKHKNALTAIIDCYGDKYSQILNYYRCMYKLNKSSKLIKEGKYVSGIRHKISAFLVSPKYLIHFYLRRYCLS